jgi:formiminoglutamase
MFKATDQELFFSKNDPQDQRLGDVVKSNIDVKENSVVILGYPDDEGIKLNGGRVGASLGPDCIRKCLYKMCPSLNRPTPPIKDLGNLVIESSLNERHQRAFAEVKKNLDQGFRVITLGGGHDYGFPDFSAFVESSLSRGKKPLIINFDAHLDVRPNNLGNNSGTPFFRLLQKYSKQHITFFEVGIQDWCNSKAHLTWAAEHGASIITLNEILASGKTLSAFLSEKILSKLDRTYDLALSLDIDSFASSAAPGASQVFPVGLDATQMLLFWSTLNSQFKARLMGVYEVSPPLDLDDRTSRLASVFAHQFIHA